MIPIQYKILAVALLLGGVFSAGAYAGYKLEHTRGQAAELASQQAAEAQYKAAVQRGDELSGRLAAAQSAIQVRTVERIKYVPQVTSGRECLSAAAVGVLDGSAPGLKLSQAAGEPVAADAAASAASDRDVADWVAGAEDQYEQCAARLNSLVTFEQGKDDGTP